MSAVEVCPDCDIAGCTHIRNRTGAFAALSQPSVSVEELIESMVATVKAATPRRYVASRTQRGDGVVTEERVEFFTTEHDKMRALLARYHVIVKE